MSKPKKMLDKNLNIPMEAQVFRIKQLMIHQL